MSASTFSISIESFLAPISEDSPAGESLRYEGTYDKIQDARRADDPTIPQGEWKTALKEADWRLVDSLCQKALTDKAKDLQVASWLMEAWIELHGVRGLHVGLQLLVALADRFWESAYPLLEEDDSSGRLAPVAWIDDKLSIKIKKLPLTRPQGSDAPSYTLADWESTLQQDRTGDGSGRTQGTTQQAKFLTGASLTAPGFYTELSQEIEGSIEAAVALEQLVDSHLPDDGASFRKLKEVLEQIQRLIASLHGTAMPMPLGKPDARGANGSIVAVESLSQAPRSRLIQSRADAYRMLIEASDYLLLTEPHSPTPYLVKRAISWGDMPLGKVLEEIVPSSESLSAIYALLGIRAERDRDHENDD
jgi:type VI secretion system protein ImpA